MAKVKFAIVAKCNPYNAKFHYHGEKVLKYDGATPVEWVLQEFDTEDEALSELYKMAKSEEGIVERTYDDVLEEIKGMDDIIDIKNHIDKFLEYEDGLYYCNTFDILMVKDGDSYSYVAMTYSVEELPIGKKAVIVTAEVSTRIIVDEDATEDEIAKAAKKNLLANLDADYADNITDISNDIDLPYGELSSDYRED
jgi:hypothetical protein